MKPSRLIFLLLAFLATISPALADSPLTSTNFAVAYMDQPMVVKASESGGGIITKQMMDYLLDKDNPVDVKMAVINALSFDGTGRTNWKTFLDYALKKKKYGKTEQDFILKATPEEMICMAYLRAMDDYFDVSIPVSYTERVWESQSYALHLVSALIMAQSMFDYDWCSVYTITDNVRNRSELLVNDLRPEANDLIFEYMDLYKQSCDEVVEATYGNYYDEPVSYYVSGPLLDINFAAAYANEPVVVKALETAGYMSEEQFRYLGEPANPLAVKLAVIYASGRRSDKANNASLFVDYLVNKKAYQQEEDFQQRGTGDELICMAFLAAMDSPDDLSRAVGYIDLSRRLVSSSGNVLLARGIIYGQSVRYDNLCEMYNYINEIAVNKSLTESLGAAVSKAVNEFVTAYSGSCNELDEVIEAPVEIDPYGYYDEEVPVYSDEENTDGSALPTPPAYVAGPMADIRFYAAYAEEPIVKKAYEGNAMLSDELLKYLADEKNLLAVKLAVIDALGVPADGIDHTETLMAYLLKKKRYKTEEVLLEKGTTDELALLAYASSAKLEGDLDRTIRLVTPLATRNVDSYSAQLVWRMIVGQMAKDTDYCGMYGLLYQMKSEGSTYTLDVNEEVQRMVYDFLVVSSQYCD